MKFSFQFKKGTRWDFDFGYKTEMFSGCHWFTIVKVDLSDSGEVVFASMIFTFLPHYKYWF